MLSFVLKLILVIFIILKLLPIIAKFLSNIEFKYYSKKKVKKTKKSPIIKLSILFGLPGSGKTTMLCHIAKYWNKRGVPIYTNCLDMDFDLLENVKYVPTEYLGHIKDVENCVLLLDEMGIELDNREYKTNFKDKDVLKWWKLYRHRCISCYLFSQTTDIDKKVRDLAESYYLVRRSILPFFTCIVPIVKKVGIDENSKQLIDAYSFPNFIDRIFNKKHRKKLIFQPFCWKYFNSWACDELPTMEQYEKDTKQMLSKLALNKKVKTG